MENIDIKEYNGVIFTNLVNSQEKEAALRTTYAPNTGKPYDLDKALGTGLSFLDRNREHIFGALSILQGKK